MKTKTWLQESPDRVSKFIVRMEANYILYRGRDNQKLGHIKANKVDIA